MPVPNLESKFAGAVFVAIFAGCLWLLWPAQDATDEIAMAPDQDRSCVAPADFAMPRIEQVERAAVRRTAVTRYTLALSWSPGFCAREGDDTDNVMQCDGATGRFGFVLHGLWPETDGRDWPQYCAPVRLVSRETLRQHLCMTPSPQLLQHEWTRHGSCMAATPEEYFAAAAQAFDRVRFPDMVMLGGGRAVRVGDLRRAFVAANPSLSADMISVQVRGGDWLDEVRLCLGPDQNYQSCPMAELGASDASPLRIEPIAQR